MTAFNIRRLHPDILAIDDGTRAWTVTVDPDRSVRRIANATSGRALKLDGPLGKRITAAVHDWLVECAEQLPAAIDEYVRTLTDSTNDAARHDAWDRCLQLGANRYDYDRARRRAEQAEAAIHAAADAMNTIESVSAVDGGIRIKFATEGDAAEFAVLMEHATALLPPIFPSPESDEVK